MNRIRDMADLNEDDRRLVEAARSVSSHAYAPYSGFKVGAAVRSKTGRLYQGANLENASYGLAVCAEIAAIAAANSAGDFNIEAIAVISAAGAAVVTPCGRCRQVISEAASASGKDIRILSCAADLSEIVDVPISELLPLSFGPGNLGR